MPSHSWLVPISLSLLLAACGSDRPSGPVCQGLCEVKDGPLALLDEESDAPAATGTPSQDDARSLTDAMADAPLRAQIQDLMQRKMETVPTGVPERALTDLPLAEQGRLRLLALSSGGPFGAFGAGFLNGWSEQTEGDLVRPESFDVVTGVSAGALLATFAFLGQAFDGDLEEAYTTISTEDVLEQRSLIKALFSNSLFDTAPLRRTLEEQVTPELLDEVAKATLAGSKDGEPTRLLLVLAVNLDSGLPRILDLGKIARDRDDPGRVDKYIDALLASAAIPVAFPPVFIEGDMHVDGGARLALFFNRFMEDQRAAIDGQSVPPPKLDIIVNSEVTVAPSCTDNSLIGIGGRSVDVVLNQLTLDSLFRTISEAERDGFDVRFVTAEDTACAPPEDPADLFEREFLQCLFAFGREVGSSDAPFKTGLEDFPELEIGVLPRRNPACPTT